MKEIIKIVRGFLRDISHICIGALIYTWFPEATWLSILFAATAANIALLAIRVYKMRQK